MTLILTPMYVLISLLAMSDPQLYGRTEAIHSDLDRSASSIVIFIASPVLTTEMLIIRSCPVLSSDSKISV